jgi:hypothetical protein
LLHVNRDGTIATSTNYHSISSSKSASACSRMGQAGSLRLLVCLYAGGLRLLVCIYPHQHAEGWGRQVA